MSDPDRLAAPGEEPGPPALPPEPPGHELPLRVRSDDELPDWLRPPAAPASREQAEDGNPPPAVPAPPEERPAPAGSVGAGAVAGVLAAIAAAIGWGLLARWAGRELDPLALAAGVLVGGAVRLVAGAAASRLQVFGMLATLGAIVVGKYLVFALLLPLEWGYDLGVLSTDTFDLFREDLSSQLGTGDLIWGGLGVAAAWLILMPWETAGAGTGDDEYHTRNPVDRLTRRLPRSLRITVDWAVTIAGAVAIVLLVKAFVVNPYRIPSSSMEPTLHCARPGDACEARFSDRVLANRFVYHFRDPKRGEIVVFETPPKACGVGGTFVKRVVGLPGERLEVRLVRGEGYVFINGKRLDEPYVRNDRRELSSSFGPITVPKDHYFMMGDNRAKSCDSREWGSLPRENLIGKVFATYWPPQRLSLH
jgi:signal peptidase I